MLENKFGKNILHKRENIAKIVTIALCGGIFASSFYMYPSTHPNDEAVTASAVDTPKEYKFTKQAIEEGITVDAAYLWPDEYNPMISAVYRDGKNILDGKMVTITKGSVYHFRGVSDTSTLYTEVYPGIIQELNMSGETAMWYSLLPSSIRKSFEDDGWIWQVGWEYTGRAYLDSDNKRVMIKSDDVTAVLYGIGLYIDDAYGYSLDKVFTEEGKRFTAIFGSTDNMFASALEYYYSRGGELHSTCPGIYSMVSDVIAGLDVQVNLPEPTETKNPSEAVEETEEIEDTPMVPMEDLFKYVNNKRAEAGLSPLDWDSADDENVKTRLAEISILMSQIRPDGSDAFSVYTDEVMCEIRLDNVYSIEDIYSCAESTFLLDYAVSFNCAVDNGKGILVFTW